IIIVVIAGVVVGDGFRSFLSVGRFARLRRSVSTRIRIITGRGRAGGGAGIHSSEYEEENMGVRTTGQIAGEGGCIVGVWAGSIGTESCVLPAAQMKEAADAGFAKIGIDEHGPITELGKGDGKIRGGGGLAFARKSAGDQNDLRRMIGLRQQYGSSQGAKRFRHL